jgi:hypothetical protein
VLLRAAVNDLKAQYKIEGHQLEDAIIGILEKKPRLRKEYKRPDPSSDRLYQSGVTHLPNNEASCAAVCDDDPSKLVLRPERIEDEDNPAIHYGLIASANQLMKNALIQDRLGVEKDVLCFEMEAACLMNHFPCLAIRGICDYSDWHLASSSECLRHATDISFPFETSKSENVANEHIAKIPVNTCEVQQTRQLNASWKPVIVINPSHRQTSNRSRYN